MPKITVSVTTVPVSGEPTTQQLEVEATVKVKDVLEAAKLESHTTMKVAMNGKAVKEHDIVPEGATLTLTEKVAGS